MTLKGYFCVALSSAGRPGEFHALSEREVQHQSPLPLQQQTQPPQQAASHQRSVTGTGQKKHPPPHEP